MIFLPDELSEAFFGGAPETAAELLLLFLVVRAGILNACTSLLEQLLALCGMFAITPGCRT